MKNQNNTYILSAVLVLAALSIVVFLVQPTLRDIKKSSREIVSNKNELASLSMQDSSLYNFRNNVKTYEASFKKINQVLLNPENPIDFIEFLEKTALDSQIQIDITLVPPVKKEDSSTPLSSIFKIATNGDFLDTLLFSEKIEQGPYLIQIKDLDIKKSAQGFNEGTLPGSVTANFLIEVLAQ